MREEERRISPFWIIPIGIILGVGAGLGLVALARAAPPTPTPGRATLYGMVTDALTGEPIAGVLVTLNGLEVYTDAGGNYAFTDLEPGEYRLEFSKEGYQALVY